VSHPPNQDFNSHRINEPSGTDWIDRLDTLMQDRVVAILDRYLVDLENGRHPSVDSIVAEYPELAAPLRSSLESIRLLNRVHGTDDSISSGANASLGLSPSQSVEGFRIGRQLGRGAMGVVYAATQTPMGNEVAIKFLETQGISNQSSIERFRREARAAESLNHPSIVPVYHIGCENGRHYYTMKLIDGTSLSQGINTAFQRNSKSQTTPPSDAEFYQSLAIESQRIEIRQIEIRQVAIPLFLPKYEFIRFNARPLVGKMVGEGEGRGGSDHASSPPQHRFLTKPSAEGELILKPSIPALFHDSQLATVTQPNAGANAVKANLPQFTGDLSQNQVVSRREPIVQILLSAKAQTQPQIQLNTQFTAEAIRTTSTSPLADSSTAKTGFNSTSVAPRDIVLQSKSTIKEIAVGPSTSKTITQTGLVGPKTETAKPTKDGMLAFSMESGGIRTESTLSDSERIKATRVRSQHQNEVLLRQMQRAQVDALIDDLAFNAKGLPVPKGMIEIRDHAVRSQRQGLVAKASSNPFEILQLFIGCSNMVQSQNALESQATNTIEIGIGYDSPESTDLATKEDILVTLGIGAALAIAIRESKIRHQKDPFFATFRRPVAQAT